MPLWAMRRGGIKLSTCIKTSFVAALKAKNEYNFAFCAKNATDRFAFGSMSFAFHEFELKFFFFFFFFFFDQICAEKTFVMEAYRCNRPRSSSDMAFEVIRKV